MSNETRVVEDDEARLEYVRTWRSVLQNVLKWPQDRVEAWIFAELAAHQDGRSIWMYHQPPTYWVTRAFIPEAIRETGMNSPWQSIYLALYRAESQGSDFSGEDVNELSKEIDLILRKFGFTLDIIRES